MAKKKTTKKPAVRSSAAPAKTTKRATAAEKSPKKKAAAKKSSVKKQPVSPKTTTKKAAAKVTKKSQPGAKAASSKKPPKPAKAREANPPKPDVAPQTRKPSLVAGIESADKAGVHAGGTNGKSPKPTIQAPEHLTVDEAHYEGPLTEDDLRKVKTGLTKKDLEYFRELLLEKRAEIVGSVTGMEQARSSGAGDVSHMPLHMADVGSDHFDQEFNLGLMESEKRLLREIDEALMRIQNGTYGVCLESGQPIPRERLEIKPWAKYTIAVVMERERRGLR